MQKIGRTASFLIVICSVFFIVSCGNNQSNTQPLNDTPVSRTLFYGKVLYTSTVAGDDTIFNKALLTFSPGAVEIYFSEHAFRMIEHGGLSHGNVLIFTDKKEAWQLDTVKKMAYLGEYSDLGDPSATLKSTLPDHYAPTVERTANKTTILGIPCTEYKILRSGFLPADDDATMWVADNLKFPPSRFDIQSEVNRSAVPTPLYIGFDEGAIMRLTVTSKTYSRTFEVTELQKDVFPPGIFEIPTDYMKK